MKGIAMIGGILGALVFGILALGPDCHHFEGIEPICIGSGRWVYAGIAAACVGLAAWAMATRATPRENAERRLRGMDDEE